MKQLKIVKPRGGKKVRKPKEIKIGGWYGSAQIWQTIEEGPDVEISATEMNAKDCLKLANWLISAAEYLKAKGE